MSAGIEHSLKQLDAAKRHCGLLFGQGEGTNTINRDLAPRIHPISLFILSLLVGPDWEVFIAPLRRDLLV